MISQKEFRKPFLHGHAFWLTTVPGKGVGARIMCKRNAVTGSFPAAPPSPSLCSLYRYRHLTPFSPPPPGTGWASVVPSPSSRCWWCLGWREPHVGAWNGVENGLHPRVFGRPFRLGVRTLASPKYYGSYLLILSQVNRYTICVFRIKKRISPRFGSYYLYVPVISLRIKK